MYKYKLHPELQAKLDQYRKEKNFDAKKWINNKIAALNEYMRKSGLKGCVVSVSGGIDSSVTAGLLSAAKQVENSPIERILLLKQPIHSTPAIADVADHLKDLPGTKLVTIDQTEFFDALCKSVQVATGLNGSAFADGNLRSYMRTPPGFYAAQLLAAAGFPAVVVGTGNYDEDGYLRYFSKAGDGVCDVQLIQDLHKSQVYEVGKALGLPAPVISAIPSADLWPGQTDEDEIGCSYDAVELLTGAAMGIGIDKFEEGLSEKALAQFHEIKQRLEGIHKRNAHKAQMAFGI